MTLIFPSSFDGAYAHLNACVGSNSGGIERYAYRQGFLEAFYSISYISHAQFYINPITEKEESANVDGLIYPMFYCLRHYVELFLKHNYFIMSNIKKINDMDLPGHNLSELFDKFSAASSVDRRLIQLAEKIEPFVRRIDAIDPTGQTFRYPENKSGEAHLSEISLINANGLTSEFQKFRDIFYTIDDEVQSIYDEYLQNTFTDNLSRRDIFIIAENLPLYSSWVTDLKTVKAKVKEIYSIGSKEFGDVLEIIKNHREFSPLIGIENKIPDLSIDLLQRLCKVSGENTLVLSDLEWRFLFGICEVGRDCYYSEQFDRIVSENWGNFLSPQDAYQDISAKNFRFHIGLIKLGQFSAISFISDNIPDLIGNSVQISNLTKFWKIN